MKLKEIFDELINVAQDAGITVKKEKGNFRGGYCVINGKEMIVLNKSTTLETMSSLVAKSLAERAVDNVYIKPVVRDFIEKEKNGLIQLSIEFNLELLK
ncbi:MAG: hypothetical protein HZB41_11915 [Ignavibacteriae bacterium]|nr:hypothetical protein [Ignavibacteriota bacterium]